MGGGRRNGGDNLGGGREGRTVGEIIVMRFFGRGGRKGRGAGGGRFDGVGGGEELGGIGIGRKRLRIPVLKKGVFLNGGVSTTGATSGGGTEMGSGAKGGGEGSWG